MRAPTAVVAFAGVLLAAAGALHRTARGRWQRSRRPLRTAELSFLVQAAGAAIRAAGAAPEFVVQSTDANAGMALGLPAVTLARGGGTGAGHTLDEWTDVDPSISARAAQLVLTTVLAAATSR